MSTQISKRDLFGTGALSAGLGVGALALLAQTQRASADTPFSNFAFTATGTPTPRTMPDRLAKIESVKDFGAIGKGIANDAATFQAAFDAAFGTWSPPNGSSGKNRTVFSPAGVYYTTAPLALRSVESGHILGAGQQATQIRN